MSLWHVSWNIIYATASYNHTPATKIKIGQFAKVIERFYDLSWILLNWMRLVIKVIGKNISTSLYFNEYHTSYDWSFKSYLFLYRWRYRCYKSIQNQSYCKIYLFRAMAVSTCCLQSCHYRNWQLPVIVAWSNSVKWPDLVLKNHNGDIFCLILSSCCMHQNCELRP